MYHGLVIIATK